MLELKNISYSAEGKEGILKNINLTIEDLEKYSNSQGWVDISKWKTYIFENFLNLYDHF